MTFSSAIAFVMRAAVVARTRAQCQWITIATAIGCGGGWRRHQAPRIEMRHQDHLYARIKRIAALILPARAEAC